MKRLVITVLGVLLAAPSWAAGGGHFAPHAAVALPVAPPPHESIAPPAARPVDRLNSATSPVAPPPHESIAPPAVKEPVMGPLVKPAWRD